MKVEQAFVGARVVDSLPFSMGGTRSQAKALKESGVDGLVGYLGHMNAARLGYILDAGLAFMPVTVANEHFDGAADELAQLKTLGIPRGATVWLDVEGHKAYNTPAPVLIAGINAWAKPVEAVSYVPGIYVGAPQPLTGEELFGLAVKRYWLGIGRCVDRFGKDAYPKAGWCMRQDWHNQGNGMLWKGTGVLVDTNAVQCDHFGRLPSWVVA
jgi:hypothetical protein